MNERTEDDDAVEAMSFEEAMAELEEIVRRLESGDVGLEESIQTYERGSRLKRHCEGKLTAAREKVERIVIGDDGEAAGTRPMEAE